jgi:hypothetical protein
MESFHEGHSECNRHRKLHRVAVRARVTLVSEQQALSDGVLGRRCYKTSNGWARQFWWYSF